MLLLKKRKERQSVLGPSLSDPTANDGAETRSSCVAVSRKTTLYHRSRGRERPQGRREDRREARKVSRAERRSCDAVPRVQSTHRTGGGRESRLR